MASKPQALLLSFFLLSSAMAFDIKEILDPYSDYSTFNKYLTDTKLVDEINSRQTITVLVVDNTAIAPLSALPADKLKNALAVHVLLDYYDPYILDRNLNKTALLTTLYQTTGHAQNGAGFVNFTELPGQHMMFGSAVPGSPLDSELIKVIGARPYNLSVLQVSKAIVPSGIGSAAPAPPTPAAATPAKATAPPPKSTPATAAPVAAPKASPAAPVEAPKASPSTPAAAPKANATTPAAAPKASATAPAAAPKSSPTETAKAPASAPAATAKAPKASAATPVAAPKSSAAAPVDAPKASAAAPTEGPAASASAPSADAPDASDASSPVPQADAEAPGPVGDEKAKPHSSAARVVVGATLGLVMGAALLGAL